MGGGSLAIVFAFQRGKPGTGYSTGNVGEMVDGGRDLKFFTKNEKSRNERYKWT